VHENGFARFAALRALAFALDGGGAGARACCEAFVAAGGLKAAFPAFMGRGLAQTRREHGARAAQQEEEYAAAAIAACLRALPPPPPGARGPPAPGAGLERLRLLAKFKEEAPPAAGGAGGAACTAGRLEKVDRLVELHVALSARVDRAAAAADEEEEEEEEDEEEEDEGAAAERASERRYVRRLHGGLVALQKVDLVIASLVAGGDEPLALALRARLYEAGGSLVRVRETLDELAERLDGGADADAAAEKRALADLVDAVGHAAGHGVEGEDEGGGAAAEVAAARGQGQPER
jgi:hypothetical protein